MTTDLRIACYQNTFVIIQDGEIIVSRIMIDGLEEEIDNIIKEPMAPKRPVQIFKKAVENLTEAKFVPSPIIDGKSCSIHDQQIYRNILEKILQNDKIVKRTQREKQVAQAREDFMKKERPVASVFRDRHTRIMKNVAGSKNKRNF